MDVTSDESAERGVTWVLERKGRLDVAINCAGVGIAGAVEDTEVDEARAQLETNSFGVLRVCRAVLAVIVSAPRLRRQGRCGTLPRFVTSATLR